MSIGIKIACFSMRIKLSNSSHLSDTYPFAKVIISSHIHRFSHVIGSFWSRHSIVDSHIWSTDSRLSSSRILYRDIVIELIIFSDPILIKGIDRLSCHLELCEWSRQSSCTSRIELRNSTFAMEHRHIVRDHYKL